ncbi:rho GTPase-activating protein 20-like [Vicugna pacos]|uniref:Rho GTPase-activating protein 20-like n=1 Tax=Vicugna pacos TaxID=30538 RepID=A0ABM5C7B6_VICPA
MSVCQLWHEPQNPDITMARTLPAAEAQASSRSSQHSAKCWRHTRFPEHRAEDDRMFTSSNELAGDHSRFDYMRESPSIAVDAHGDNASPYEGTQRVVMMFGPAKLQTGWRKKKRQLFLYRDKLLISNTKYRWNFKIKYEIPLNNVWMGDCTNKAGEAINAPKSFVLGWPTVNFVATFNSSERRDKWRAFLERYIDLAKEKEQPKTIPLKIFTEDINNCASSITIKILNTHTVNDVINLSLSKLGITGSEKDYQLWVTAGKKNTSYPLIGHEHPFGIKTSHLPATALLPQGPEDSASPSALLEAILLEKRSPDTQGQFVLKPRHPARSQQGRAKRTYVSNWAFWRRPRPRQDNQRPPPPSAKRGQLFGAPLGDVCVDDKLPAPVLEMLSTLSQKGPLTKRIFLKNASKTSCRALKQRLDSGDTVNMEDESILVLASVLKDFLQNIEGGIFTASLLDKWLRILDDGKPEETITATRRLLDKLPKANADLLRHLFGALHNIEHHSTFNHMTSYNLAQCIAPSLLGPPNATSSHLQEDLTKMVSLVQFLLENRLQLWGEDTPPLWGGRAATPDEVTTGCLESTRMMVAVIYTNPQGQYEAKCPSSTGRRTCLSTIFEVPEEEEWP